MSKIVAFHSFGRGTGKSCLTANLAALLAGAGRRVGVVEADLTAPSQTALWELDDAALGGTLNDYLWGRCDIGEVVHDLTPQLRMAGPGRVCLAPASPRPNEVARILRGGVYAHTLDEALEALSAMPEVDLWLADTPAGLTEEALTAFGAADELVVLLLLDRREYQGTAVTLDVARQLGVPQVRLLLNQLPAAIDPDEAKKKVETTYRCEVVGVLPFSAEQAALGSSGLFAWQHPNHPLTALLLEIAARLGV
jgi:septum site-determining protein MinD